VPVDDNETATPGAYAPYAQLVKMLMPSAGSVAIYDCEAELVWCSDGYERPDLRVLLEQQRVSETLASRGRVDNTREGVPVFISALRAADARPLGSVVIELGSGTRSTPSMVVSMLRPVLDCLERQLDLERSSLVTDRSAGFELLLGVDEQDQQDASALHELLRDRRSVDAGQEHGDLLHAGRQRRAITAARSHAEAPARMGPAQQSSDGRESWRGRNGCTL
jgi:hypothetical protein